MEKLLLNVIITLMVPYNCTVVSSFSIIFWCKGLGFRSTLFHVYNVFSFRLSSL